MGCARWEAGAASAASAPPPPRATSAADRPVTVTQESNARSAVRGRLIDAPTEAGGRGGGRAPPIFGLDQFTVKVLYSSLTVHQGREGGHKVVAGRATPAGWGDSVG